MSNQMPSFFLPYVEANISDNEIKRVFEVNYDLGDVNFIDRIQKMDAYGCVYFWVYIHFQSFKWDDRTFELIRDSKNFKNPPRFYYEQGPSPTKFWKVLFNKATRKPSMPEIKISERIPDVSQDCSHFPHIPTIVSKMEQKPKESKFQFVPRSIQMKKKVPRSHVAEGKIGKPSEQEEIKEEA